MIGNIILGVGLVFIGVLTLFGRPFKIEIKKIMIARDETQLPAPAPIVPVKETASKKDLEAAAAEMDKLLNPYDGHAMNDAITTIQTLFNASQDPDKKEGGK